MRRKKQVTAGELVLIDGLSDFRLNDGICAYFSASIITSYAKPSEVCVKICVIIIIFVGHFTNHITKAILTTLPGRFLKH